ncbi:uncharacterized protein LOC129293144 [Prosopis cineraria]|uniref:uncharacterized protein LOC129293144 n=1 Tax=Prosopis cineraria TaxID=364024 RepID=UPI00240F77AA|nr:uncharacterized protein LOC129293144 [Prosopis cineraria]
MDSSATLPKQLHAARKHPPPPQQQWSRRTPSFSSSSSSFSPYNSSSSLESLFAGADDVDEPSPYSPLRFSGVPFSWELLPGIPKKQTCFRKKLIQESSMKLLPLPPPTNTSSYNFKKKNSLPSIFQRDPFFAAMVECSKGGDDHEEEDHDHQVSGRSSPAFWNSNNAASRGGRRSNNNKGSRSISDRFGFVSIYSSCKNASPVSESIIYLPTSRRSRSNYQHFSRRSLGA